MGNLRARYPLRRKNSIAYAISTPLSISKLSARDQSEVRRINPRLSKACGADRNSGRHLKETVDAFNAAANATLRGSMRRAATIEAADT